MKTLISLILDRSGSMSGRETDVIGGVNKFIEDQKRDPAPAWIAFTRFDSQAIERFRELQPLAYCLPLGIEDFQPRGGTPLLDAIGQSIVRLEGDVLVQQPDRVIVVIVTDGAENDSKEYKKAQVQSMVKSRQEGGKWAFVYLGANVDAFTEGASMGFSGANIAGYKNSGAGVGVMYAAMSQTVSTMRSTGATVAKNLGKNLGE